MLCPNSNNSLLAYPGPSVGHVCMVDLADVLRQPVDISAHEAAISCIALNQQGTRLATASEKVPERKGRGREEGGDRDGRKGEREGEGIGFGRRRGVWRWSWPWSGCNGESEGGGGESKL